MLPFYMFRPRHPLPRPDLTPVSLRVSSSAELCARRLPRPGRGISALSPRCRTLLQNTVRVPSPPKTFPRFLCPPVANPFRIRTCKKCARNPFRIRTYKTQDLKSFRISTYKKRAGGGVLLLTSYPRRIAVPRSIARRGTSLQIRRRISVPNALSASAGRPSAVRDLSPYLIKVSAPNDAQRGSRQRYESARRSPNLSDTAPCERNN